ncbi:isocitrate lyase ICL2 [Candidatus Poriferisocius sp.]|uniref:isocitrate lyase ICL2 n=1 Tax=Candidatus Poriferisocius sp. TaxID=3101276 RepID=UPI003B02BB0B
MAVKAAGSLDSEVRSTQEWMASPRFEGLTRLYSARQVVEQRGSIPQDYPVARVAAERFYTRLRELFDQGRCISTFGPYSPGQAVAMKRAGIEGIYLGGWATSAKGSLHEDPGPDLASYPLSMVPDEAAGLVRALLTADRNQQFARSRMSVSERQTTSMIDFTPAIIADADTGHGGDPHVRNLIRRFVEAGVPGYHIEDQKPGLKKCGHQGGKVLVPCDEQIKRLNAARFQLDVMGVAGIIVARTDAEAANLLDGGTDERDQPFIMGATQPFVPSYKDAYLAVLRRLAEAGVDGVNGHLLYAVPESRYARASAWLDQSGVGRMIEKAMVAYHASSDPRPDDAVDRVSDALAEAWHRTAGLATYAQAVADQLTLRSSEGETFGVGVEEWLSFAGTVDTATAHSRAIELGLDVAWDPEVARTTEGYYQVQGGIPYAVAKSLAVAPFCDLLWMETKTADLDDAREFAEAIHAVYPDKMLAYNLSPSFNWDTTGMSEDEMREFPTELGRMGFVFNFITYGGHQVDGMAGEEFAASLQQDGMLALARLQRKFRLVDSPYRTPQTLVGGPRLDAALMASSGRTATTRAMGKGSTQFQHLVQTEVPTRELEAWLERWAVHNGVNSDLKVRLRPYTAGSEVLELAVLSSDKDLADVVFGVLHDRRGRAILSVRDQNTHSPALRRKRLMALMHLYLIRRYNAVSVQYLTPTDDNYRQTAGMKDLGFFTSVSDEVGEIIVANVDEGLISKLVSDQDALQQLIAGRNT